MITKNFHDAQAIEQYNQLFVTSRADTRFVYRFQNFFHPYVGELVTRLNQTSVVGVLDASWQSTLVDDFFTTTYTVHADPTIGVAHDPKRIDLEAGGPYANYNWELGFHIPVTIAVHLSKNQRFAEAQKWFHYVFDPTSDDVSVPAPQRYWRFLAFRNLPPGARIDELLRILATPEAECTPDEIELRNSTLQSYQAILDHPFQPHVVARPRVVPYQYSVVMKYLDNLVSWGDSLFAQDTIETINEATQIYVLAANILGPRPQRMPSLGTTTPKTFAQLKAQGLDATGNVFVDLEGQFPLDISLPAGSSDGSGSAPLFGLGRTLYFGIPANAQLFGYWDTVADRLYKIRNSLNLQGVFRQLALFDPPIDPGMLVKAAAAGLDISAVIAGLNAAPSPVRAKVLISQALALASEVRSMGGALLSALEKQDGEKLALLRQGHESTLQRLNSDVRFLQWKQAQEATEVLLRTRATTLERYHAQLRLLGIAVDTAATPDALPLDRRELTVDNFDEAYDALVAQYATTPAVPSFPALRLAQASSPAMQSGATGSGPLYLDVNEDLDLNVFGPSARDQRVAAQAIDTVSGVLSLIPDMGLDLHYWGLGGHAILFGGSLFANQGRFLSNVLNLGASIDEGKGIVAGKTAVFQRRADDWVLGARTAGAELAQIGRQILGALIAEQVAKHEYDVSTTQVQQADEVGAMMRDKFTNDQLYGWMQGELSKTFYDYYRTAVDVARKAEKATKRELMRSELDNRSFVAANYWDGGRKGLLSGEPLYLDVKKLELAYQEQNRRELELTRNISLRQLDPVALLNLRTTGSCDFTIPESLFDRDTPGHYLRRLKTVAVSIPAVAGPYTPVTATLSLVASTTRVSSQLADGGYARTGVDDARFTDAAGGATSITTSTAVNDTGLFETNLGDERPLPFESAGAVSTWHLTLPTRLRSFDHATIADVVLHLRYTARDAGALLADRASTELGDLVSAENNAGLALLFAMEQEFSVAWSTFLGSAADLSVTIRREHFPFWTQGLPLVVEGLDLYAATGDAEHRTLTRRAVPVPATLADDLASASAAATLTVAADATVLRRDPTGHVFLAVRYRLDL